MRRWDRLLDSHIEEYRARGSQSVSPHSVAYTEARLNRQGWGIKRIDAEMITRYAIGDSGLVLVGCNFDPHRHYQPNRLETDQLGR